MRVGRYGPYLQKQQNGENLTASLPAEISPAEITNELAEKLIKQKIEGPTPLGMHPEEGLPIFVYARPIWLLPAIGRSD